MIRFFLLLIAMAGLHPIVQAQIVVTTSADEDDGDALPGNGSGTSLREAVKYASPGNTITFMPALSGQTISVTNGQMLVTKSVTVDASALADGVTIHGHGLNGLFHFGSQTTNTFIGLTLTGGRTTQWGGAILNNSVLTLNDCTLAGNIAAEGGAIFQFRPTTLNNCTVVSNYARCGGGIYNDGDTVMLNNSTVAFNLATNDGGGIFNFFGLTLNQCTIAGNQATLAGGINNEGTGTLTLRNSIVAGNTASLDAQIAGSINFPSGINITSGDPMLAPLGDYGGRTHTMPPLPGSPAIDPVGGQTNSAFATDQRGLPRLVNGIVDVGAVEVQSASIVPIQISGAELPGDGTFQLSFSNLNGVSFSVLATTNVVLPSSNWPAIGPAVENPPGSGRFEFNDSQTTNLPQRFYRVTFP